ncbi:hypothetical protein B0H66DRAFT_211855 [Apodospora peruviana]|uniref:Riboflavin kinase n=1 Tax=Apodospora peruviana TaxID=516989 RepID=A0AAE0ICX3_9PEZI|nr:hypothetical protein B0H66DRAFT_211855 [Apodospora peruviana]
MDQHNYYFNPPPIRRKPTATEDNTPPPPYSPFDLRDAPKFDTRSFASAPGETTNGYPYDQNNRDFLNVHRDRPRPVSRGHTHNPLPSQNDQMLHPPPLPSRLRVMTSMPNLAAPSRQFDSPISPSPSPSSSRTTSSAWNTPITPPPVAADPPTDNKPTTFWQNAVSETLHLAGGLVPHPTESTKHYTILRHSPPLIFYRGPATSVAITIFSSADHPLPRDRTLWLQQRGFSGDSGMKLKALVGATAAWLDVTPSSVVQVSDLGPDTDERSWQRDIAKATKKLAHVARETHVVRIPEASADGYFRLVLCTGGDDKKRKTLCPSPIFRVASTSTDSSVFRGASLSTIPLEVGVKVASVIASNTVNRYVGPVAGRIQGRLDKIQPGFVAREAGQRAFGAIGLKDKFGQKHFDAAGVYQEQHFFASGQGGLVVMGSDDGPQRPYPLKLSGRIVPGTGRGGAELGIPTANLATSLPDDLRYNLEGVYFGWASVLSSSGKGIDAGIAAGEWYEAVITAGRCPISSSARPSVISETEVKVHLVQDFGQGTIFGDVKMKVIVMGFLRPHTDLPPGMVLSVQDKLDIASQDVLVTMASLGRENWGPDVTIDRLKTAKSSRSLSDKFSDARGKVQNQVGKIPVHLAGIRTPDGEARDKLHGIGGYWVAR